MNLSDIAYLEWLSFDVCDQNDDEGLTWQEVEDCIVSLFHVVFEQSL